jgi:hypothetical protein
MAMVGLGPIVAIVCGSISGIIKMKHQHAERMEMIRLGMHPDGGKPAQVSEI